MKFDGENLKIAVQKKGRLAEPSRQILKSIGLSTTKEDYSPPVGIFLWTSCFCVTTTFRSTFRTG